MGLTPIFRNLYPNCPHCMKLFLNFVFKLVYVMSLKARRVFILYIVYISIVNFLCFVLLVLLVRFLIVS